MSYEPFQKSKTRHSRAQIERFFGPKSSGAEAQKLRRENEVLYDELRAEAVVLGILDKPYEHPWKKLIDAQERKELGQTFDDETLTARVKYSEARCRELFVAPTSGSKDNAAELMRTSPEEYAAARLAAVSYGLLPEQPATSYRRPPKPQTPPDDGGITVSDALAAEANLPIGTRVAPEQLETIVRAVAERKMAAAEAAKGETNQ